MPDGSPPLALHRCRFVDASPSPITALAFPPLPLPPLAANAAGKQREPGRDRGLAFGTLVVGHANGNIDLLKWTGELGESQASQAWHRRKTLPGPYPSKVDSLVLTIRYPDIFPSDMVPSPSDLRMFSSGGGSELLEWDMARNTIRRTISSQGGSIWSMAANSASTLLALGCEDGCIRLLSLSADTLQHFRRFDHVKCRILSIAWGPPVPQQPKPKANDSASQRNGREESEDDSEDEEHEWTDSWLVTGGSDSSLRKWDISTGRSTDRMGTDKIKGDRTLVWTVGVLADGTIISGDSLGIVKFWDPMTCTQTHSFAAHGADVLCLTIGPDGTTVFTSGVDQKIVQFTYVSSTSGSSSSTMSASTGRWIQSASRRMHSHDVRSLAMWPPYRPLPPVYRRKFAPGVPFIAPVLVSGGLDMSVVLTPCLPASMTTSTVAARVINPLATSVVTTFEDSYYRRVPYFSAVSVARSARLVSYMHETGLNIWRVLNIPSTAMVIDGRDNSTDPELRVSWESMLEMEFVVQTNLIASALSDDGRWLVVSDLYETKLFELCKTPTGEMQPRRIRSLTAVLEAHISISSSKGSRSTGGSYFIFTPDSSKMVLASVSTSFILIIDLITEEPTVLRRFDQHRKSTSLSGGRLVRGSSRSQVQDAADDEGELPQSDGPPSVVRMAVSPDGQWLATSDELCRTSVFNLDSIQYHGALPSLPHPPNVLTFTPEKPHILMIVLPNNTIHVFDVERSEVPAWAYDLNSRIPKQLFNTSDPVLGVIFEPGPTLPSSALVNGDLEMTDVLQKNSGPHSTTFSQKEAIFWGSSWLCKLKLDWLGKYTEQRKRRKSEARHPTQEHQGAPTFAPHPDLQNLRMVTHYRPILALDFVGPGELVLVERPLVDVLSKLPPAFFKPKYGQT
ncbi:WD40 repeat-like protein [Butyriboletus roseoflavus]|nr:WD40 repeat-like protein [Butyriboletus roseoflavus]